MPRIDVEYVDGTKEVFEETSRSGGSYCTTIRYESGFAIIENADGEQIIIPDCRIKKIKKESSRRW